GFRNADTIDAGVLQLQRRRHRPVAADDDEAVNAQPFQNIARIGDHFLRDFDAIARSDFRDEMPAIRRADDGAAARHDAGGSFAIEDDVISRRQQTFEAIQEPEDFPAQLFRGQDDTAQDGVQAGTIAAARQDADTR